VNEEEEEELEVDCRPEQWTEDSGRRRAIIIIDLLATMAFKRGQHTRLGIAKVFA